MKWYLCLGFILLAALSSAQLDFNNLEQIDDSVVRDKCDQRGGKGTFDAIKNSRDSVQSCVEDLISLDTLRKEIEDAKKTGSLDEVFGKYCNKRPQFKQCFEGFLTNLKKCLTTAEIDNMNIGLDVIKQLGDFACHKDGDRIAMFVAEGGPECIKSQIEGIKSCVNKTIKFEEPSIDSLPSFLTTSKVCDDMSKMQPCIVTELEKCENTTSANIVDAIFRFIKKNICNKKKNKRSVRSKRGAVAIGANQINQLKDTYMKYIRAKCIENKSEKEFINLESSFETTKKCVISGIKNNLAIILTVQDLKDRVTACTDDFMSKAEDCLAEKDKFYPRFAQEILFGMIDIIYKYKPNITLSSWNPDMTLCLQNFKYYSNRKKIISCFEEEVTITKSYDRDYLCQRLPEATKCVREVINSTCIRSLAVDTFLDDLTGVFLKPCQLSNDNVNIYDKN